MKRLIFTLLALTTVSTAGWASELTQQQQSWLDQTLIELYGPVGQAPADVKQLLTDMILDGSIDVTTNPLGVDDGQVPNMSGASCDVLAAGVRDKVYECVQLRDDHAGCLGIVPPENDPVMTCKAISDLTESCMAEWGAIAEDHQKYCGS